MSKADVVIVGAGLAGLSCALSLREKGLTPLILEASDAPGGRVRTDSHEGFLLDRGFQVYLTAYPEGKRLLDEAALGFKAFKNGAKIRQSGKFLEVTDPWRSGKLLEMAFSPVGTFSDKMKLSGLRSSLRRQTVDALLEAPDASTRSFLQAQGFSDRFIDRMIKPLFGGVMLDSTLVTSSRMFTFVMKMMAEGDTVVPEKGMGAIPAQLAARLPDGMIRLNSAVQSLNEGSVTLASGEVVKAPAIVLACDAASASSLTPSVAVQRWRSVNCVYFDAPAPPIEEPWLVLNGNNQWPIHNLVAMSEVSPAYAPKGRALISASVLGRTSQTDESLAAAVQGQAERWFGKEVRAWKHLRSYRIAQAQPEGFPNPAAERPCRLRPGLYAAGDYTSIASIHFALESGRLAAEAAIADLGGTSAAAQSA